MKHFPIKLCFFIITCFVFLSCKKMEKATPPNILTIIKDSLQVQESYSKVLVVQKRGCSLCNQKFNEYIKENLEDRNTLIIFSGANMIEFLKNVDTTAVNIIYDRKQLFYKTNTLNTSAAVLMNKNEIDTILNLSDARVFNRNLEYLSER